MVSKGYKTIARMVSDCKFDPSSCFISAIQLKEKKKNLIATKLRCTSDSGPHKLIINQKRKFLIGVL